MLFKRTRGCVQYLIWLMFTVFVVGLSANCGVKPHPLHHLWGLRNVGSEPLLEKVSIKIQLHWAHESFLLFVVAPAYLGATLCFSLPLFAAGRDWDSRQLLSEDVARGKAPGLLSRHAGTGVSSMKSQLRTSPAKPSTTKMRPMIKERSGCRWVRQGISRG